MSIKNWPKSQRPRERLLRDGANALSEAELLAIVLRTGVPGKTVMQLALDILQAFDGDIGALLMADFADIQSREVRGEKIKGLGPAKYCQMRAVAELAKRHLNSKMRNSGFVMKNPEEVREYLSASMRKRKREAMHVMLFDSKNHLICQKDMFLGTLNKTQVAPREVVRYALRHNAAAVCMAHNHPSGCNEPSRADMEITRRIRDALRLVDVRLLDHFVVGDEVLSLRERDSSMF